MPSVITLLRLSPCLFAFGLAITAMQAGKAHSGLQPEHSAFAQLQSPTRAGMLQLDRELSTLKPLKRVNLGGILYADNRIYGHIADDWFGAVDAETGDLLWATKLTEELTTRPHLIEGSLLLGLRDGLLMRVRRSDGQVEWSSQLDSFVDRPLMHRGKVIVAITATQKVYAIDSTSNQQIWLHDAGQASEFSLANASTALMDEKSVYIGRSQGDILALDITSGTRQAVVELGPPRGNNRFNDIIGRMAFTEQGILFSRYDGLVGVVAFTDDRSSGSLVWSQTFPRLSASTLANDAFYLGTVTGELIALSKQGSTWVERFRSPFGQTVKTIQASSNEVFLTGSSGWIGSYQRGTGKANWLDRLGTDVETPAVFGEDRVFFSSSHRTVYKYLPQTSKG